VLALKREFGKTSLLRRPGHTKLLPWARRRRYAERCGASNRSWAAAGLHPGAGDHGPGDVPLGNLLAMIEEARQAG